MTTTQNTGSTPAPDPVVEIRSTRETAEKIAKDGAAEGTDIPRLLAGLIAHLADQMEKMAAGSSTMDTPESGDQGRGSAAQVSDATREEDISPEDAPAAPARDPNAEEG